MHGLTPRIRRPAPGIERHQPDIRGLAACEIAGAVSIIDRNFGLVVFLYHLNNSNYVCVEFVQLLSRYPILGVLRAANNVHFVLSEIIKSHLEPSHVSHRGLFSLLFQFWQSGSRTPR